MDIYFEEKPLSRVVSKAKFDKKILVGIRSRFNSRAKEPNKGKRLNQEELLVNDIKFEAVSLLLEKGLIL